MRKQKEKKDFWDKHKNLLSESSSDKSRFDEYSLDEQNTNEKSLEVDNGRGNNIQERLGYNNKEVQLKDENPIFKPVWKDNIDRYL